MNVLVVAAHPDDEVLGCGGTVLRHVAAGDSVSVILVAQGVTSRSFQTDPAALSDVASLREASFAAAGLLGTSVPVHLNFADNRLDEIALLDVVQRLECEIRRIQPQIIYTHYRGDLNIDHRVVYEAVLTAARPIPGCPVKAIYCFETPSSTEWGVESFHPQRYIDITNQLDRKLQALNFYASEMRKFPHPRSMALVEALARVRGASCGLAAAEAFEVVREVCFDSNI
jgi:LmbE family N-acetylglucosaminyl deacetylase